MINETLISLISIDMWWYHKSTFMYSHQRSKVTCMWKIIFVQCRPVGGQRGVHRDPNEIAAQRSGQFFSNTCQKMRGGMYVIVKERWREDILRFRADGTPLTT